MTQLVIDETYQKLVPILSDDDYQSLKESIKQNGLWMPILVNKENIILDGHHRFKICQELGTKIKYAVREFPTKSEETIFVGECNLKRRQLTPLQRINLVRLLEPYYNKIAKSNMITAHSSGNITGAKGDTRDKLGKKANVSGRTYEKGTKILENASPEVIEKINKGETSISYAYKTINRQEKKKNAEPIPTGQFDVILADPPWKYDINTRGSPDDHYDVMDDQAINDLKIPSADNCVLFMWGTAPKLVEAMQVIEAWGFTYKTNMVWIKDKIGTGYYFRGKHELLLVAVKGHPLIPEEKDRPESVLIAPRTKHSKKPEEIYSIIERMYPNAKYLELFARNTKKNWKSWGNEIA